MIEIMFLFIGMGVLLGSAELMIWAIEKISVRLGISHSFIGLTVLSIGTSLPEIGTHVISSIDIIRGIEVSGVAVGTNIGSNLMQITLILGLTALFTKVYAPRKFLRKDYAVMMFSIILLFVLSIGGYISQAEGLILVAIYLAYLWKLGKTEQFISKVSSEHSKDGKSNIKYYAYATLGMAMLLAAAYLVVENAVALSEIWGIEKSFIGAVIIGFGTALPEFTTAMVAMRKKLPAMSVGVLVGSNITNPLFALGIGAAISGYSIVRNVLLFDIPSWFFVSLAAMVFLYRGKEGIRKHEALVMIGLYLTYLLIRMSIAGVII